MPEQLTLSLGSLVSSLMIGCNLARMYCDSVLGYLTPPYPKGMLSRHTHHDNKLSISEEGCMPYNHKAACAASKAQGRCRGSSLLNTLNMWCPTACKPPPHFFPL